MTVPQPGDILIADANASRPGEFMLADAVTHRMLQGPVTSLREAVTLALVLADGGAIWRENLDGRGRTLGPPQRLPFKT